MWPRWKSVTRNCCCARALCLKHSPRGFQVVFQFGIGLGTRSNSGSTFSRLMVGGNSAALAGMLPILAAAWLRVTMPCEPRRASWPAQRVPAQSPHLSLVCVWPCVRYRAPSGVTLVQRRLSGVVQVSPDAFEAVDGGQDRVCRGSNEGDDDGSYYVVRSIEDLESCKTACVETPRCKGIEFRPGRCEVWVRPGGIQATAATVGATCLRFIPFVSLAEQACRGANASDNNPAYYQIQTAASLAGCQQMCLESQTCRGIEFSGTRCELWTRNDGISESVPLSGSICQPLAPFVLLGMDRGCRGKDEMDLDSRFFTRHSVTSLETCKSMCAKRGSCKGIEFGGTYCDIWTRVSGIQATAPVPGALCMRFSGQEATDAFGLVDGGVERACRGENVSDWSASYFEFFWTSRSLEDCKSRCVKHPACKGIEFNSYGCKVWTVPGGITTSISFGGSTCLRYVAFRPVDGGSQRGCYGPAPAIVAPHIVAGDVLEGCESLCAQSPGCRGVEVDSSCRVWSSTISGSYTNEDMTCLRYEPFISVGGLDRSCGGMDPTDHWPGYYSVASVKLSSCKSLCMSTPGCNGIQYEDQICQVWQRRGGIQATSERSGSLCLRLGAHDPWQDHHAFGLLGYDHACSGDMIQQYSVGTLDLCQLRCVAVPKCRGIDFGPHGCRLWQGELQAYSESGSSCYEYKPFRDVDGGSGRDCRGSSSSDHQSSHFLQLQASSLQECQDHCVEHAERDVEGIPCKGLSYNSVSQDCHLWIRREGIGATVASENSKCQRYEPLFGEVDYGCGSGSTSSSTAHTLEACRALCRVGECRGQGVRRL